MKEFYIYPTQEAAQAALDNLNSWPDITGLKKGQPQPDCQKTLVWADNILPMVSGEYAVPRVTPQFLTSCGGLEQDIVTQEWRHMPVSHETINEFLSNYAPSEIRTVSLEEFIRDEYVDP